MSGVHRCGNSPKRRPAHTCSPPSLLSAGALLRLLFAEGVSPLVTPSSSHGQSCHLERAAPIETLLRLARKPAQTQGMHLEAMHALAEHDVSGERLGCVGSLEVSPWRCCSTAIQSEWVLSLGNPVRDLPMCLLLQCCQALVQPAAKRPQPY